MDQLVALVRIEVDDLERALPLYEELVGGGEVRRFSFGEVRLAWLGPFLLLEGEPEALARVRRTGTLLTPDLERARRAIEAAGGAILDAPAPGPNGPRMLARHPDGAVLEYIEHAVTPPRRDRAAQ